MVKLLSCVALSAVLLVGCSRSEPPVKPSTPGYQSSEPTASLRSAYGEDFRAAAIESGTPEGAMLVLDLAKGGNPASASARPYADLALLVSLRPGLRRYEVRYDMGADVFNVVWLAWSGQLQFRRLPAGMGKPDKYVDGITTATVNAVAAGRQPPPQLRQAH